MRDDMHENLWSPFDPEWYQKAFDQFISTADMLFNQNLIIEQGYQIPDADGSRSSVFRKTAVLNNSFNEKLLRETLTELYNNSSHKLVASNHDNINFFKWEGKMSDVTYLASTNQCEIRIPWKDFIYPKERDAFKMSQFYRRWIKLEELLNNWEIFKWHLLVFINQKIYGEYELFIDEQEILLRFTYYDYWAKMDFPIYVYKMDTNYQHRRLVSRELIENQWNWKIPISEISDKKILNHSRVIIAFNKLTDPEYRKDGQTRIEVLGDNLEFLEVKDGFIDLSTISNFNRAYILSELKEWLWMSIFVPKFLHEYPVLLPTDVMYRPYEPKLMAVSTLEGDRTVKRVKAEPHKDDHKQVYVDLNNNKIFEYIEGWHQLFRPIVLTDAFENPTVEPYDLLFEEVRGLRDASAELAVFVEEFRFFLKEHYTPQAMEARLEKLSEVAKQLFDVYNAFFDKRRAGRDAQYRELYEGDFISAIESIRQEGEASIYLAPENQWDQTFWTITSSLIIISRELVEKFHVIEIIRQMSKRTLWTKPESFLGQVRFQRPIEENDFWLFEYDLKDDVWRPAPSIQVKRQFPDVYLLNDPKDPTSSLNRIFKAFFFYSDTMSATNLSREIERPTPAWDEGVIDYHVEQGAVYRDIFMEKFYWMGIRSIYKGLLITNTRWEVLEYIIDNPIYDRFNQLFLQTMDPYFKLGLATYLKSDNFEFPFDDAIEKFHESVTINWNAFKRITNFEAYLNKQWIPSYFDYITKVMDDFDWQKRLYLRPSGTFDMKRIYPILIEIQTEIVDSTREVLADIKWALTQLAIEDYHLKIEEIELLRDTIQKMLVDMEYLLKFINKLDMELYGLEEINFIIQELKKHNELIDGVRNILIKVNKSVQEWYVVERKFDLIFQLTELMNKIEIKTDAVLLIIEAFDMYEFMLVVNDLRSYLDHSKNNPDDKSVNGLVNQFNDPWSVEVKEARNRFFISSAILYAEYNPTKTFTGPEVDAFVKLVDAVKEDLASYRKAIEFFWVNKALPKEQELIDRLDHGKTLIDQFQVNIFNYFTARNDLTDEMDKIKAIFSLIDETAPSKRENNWRDNILTAFEEILAAVSYITGNNRRDDAEKELDGIMATISEWLIFLAHEKDVFNVLFNIIKQPSVFIIGMEKHANLLSAVMEYLNSVNERYIPDKGRPTYSEVFEIDSISIDTTGFWYKEGDTIFVPRLGSYKVSEINSDIGRVTAIVDMEYRKTFYRDPCLRSNPYDTISDGIGAGLMIRALSSKRKKIINDTVIITYLIRIENLVERMYRFLQNPNPYNNIDFKIVLDSFGRINDDWNDLLKTFKEYLSDETKQMMKFLLTRLETVKIPADEFMKGRDKIAVQSFAGNWENLLTEVYRYAVNKEKLNEDFLNDEGEIRAVYHEFLSFIGPGTSWDNSKRLLEIIDSARRTIWIYEKRIFPRWEQDETVKGFREKIVALDADLSRVAQAINVLPSLIPSIKNALAIIIEEVRKIDQEKLYKDVWYRMTKIRPAMSGEGYEAGDIVEIIPQMPVDDYGKPIETELEDVIMNDVILLQIVRVDEGQVVEVKALHDYALPYSIWGLRETKARTGKGEGLMIDVFSYELSLSDSTLLNNEASYVSNAHPFGENDLFAFKFENIHDLDIHYEVFLGGKQVTNFLQRHEEAKHDGEASMIDAIYLNANEVIDLENSSIYIPAEHYFVYKIESVEIKDPGAGYCVGQEIFVDVDNFVLRLKVAKLLYEPYKGIDLLEVSTGKLFFDGGDPKGENARVATDSLNNIDDEYNVGYYDKLKKDGIKKAATLSYPEEEYSMLSKRFDKMDGDDRNETFMYPTVPLPIIDPMNDNGDPDENWYQGTRIDGGERWEGAMNLIPPTDPFIPDHLRLPPNLPQKGEYQLFEQLLFHRGRFTPKADLTVPTKADLPKHCHDWPKAMIGKTVLVLEDESFGGHQTLYRLRTFVAFGYFVWNWPTLADEDWNHLEINWMESDWHPDLPGLKDRYPSAPWRNIKTFRDIEEGISDERWPQRNIPELVNVTSYIRPTTKTDSISYTVGDLHSDRYVVSSTGGETTLSSGELVDISLSADRYILPSIGGNVNFNVDLQLKLILDDLYDALSVFNWTEKMWENLRDTDRWRIEVYEELETKKWGFKVTFLLEGEYAYDMKFYWNKTPTTQKRNASLKRNAIMDISAVITDEVNIKASNTSVNTGRTIRIRKLFPYEQKERFKLGIGDEGEHFGSTMNFKLNPYLHFRNQLQVQDLKLFNRTANRFENLLNPSMFEIRFKDPRMKNRGKETQTRVVQSLIARAGEAFVDGPVWGYNQELGIHLFGEVSAALNGVGNMLTFRVTHCPNPPQENIALEFQIYQRLSQTVVHAGIVLVEFKTEELIVYDDGYIHDVLNPLAPLPKEFQVIVKYPLEIEYEYDLILSKRPKKWTFIDPNWIMTPIIPIEGENLNHNQIYFMTDKGRFPLINPSTGLPTHQTKQTAKGTEVTFLNIYRRYEHLEVRVVPYPMRSVYVQRRIPAHGFIDLDGKLNKPLNKKYFEFWMNGRLLHDEVTIISPTKLILHGLISLRNFEIIEVNRDANEYFSDIFLEKRLTSTGRPVNHWDYKTYLDGALEGTLEGDNYSLEEQEYLLTPVWPQVDTDHPSFKDYPPNVDLEDDIIQRIQIPEDFPVYGLDDSSYQFMLIDPPSLENLPITNRGMRWEQFGWRPISDEMVIDMLNQEWAEEIRNEPHFHEHIIISDDEWYGTTARLYDEYGILTHNLNEAAYRIADLSILNINSKTRSSRIIHNQTSYDLN